MHAASRAPTKGDGCDDRVEVDRGGGTAERATWKGLRRRNNNKFNHHAGLGEVGAKNRLNAAYAISQRNCGPNRRVVRAAGASNPATASVRPFP